ncbi:hypothetical protein [Halorussus sp. MSC15.2]|uniref:hypothetical protein n=1 Tax=Halorussus sp. MSC15.2 TaxID=2283638 RepID=UPI0013D295B9|nr:hypothetical protein [Halorussus sp. MSC15.2]NEU55682.1 hypothetical protein [Halorussus sp. MSC15.2]
MRTSGTELPSEDVPDDEYEFRLPAETSLGRWLVFDANRLLLASLVVAGVFAWFLALTWSGTLVVTNENTASLLLSVFVAGNFTLISIVITINQLVLSREFGKPHTLRERNEGIKRFRESLESLAGVTVGPPDPLELLRMVLRNIADRTNALREATGETDDPRLRAETDRLADTVTEETERVDSTLDESQLGDFDVLVSMLFYRSAWQLNAARRIRGQYADTLPESAAESLDELEELLRGFNVARQYVQTLYMQKELAELSRLLLYVGVPSLVVSSSAMLVYRDPGVTVGAGPLVVVYSAVAAAAFAPIAILLSYVIRVSTIVSRMPLLSPFVTDG